MSIVNDTNYTNQIPVAADYTIFVRDSDGVLKTATMQQLADLFQSLANLNVSVSFISSQQTLSDEQLVIANSGSSFQIDLPANALNTGRGYRIYNQGAGNVTIVPNGVDTIGGGASQLLATGESVTIYADGLGNWTTFGAP